MTQVAIYRFSSFFAPVENLPVFNRAQAGKSIPVKVTLGGDRGPAIFAPDYPKSQQIPCD